MRLKMNLSDLPAEFSKFTAGLDTPIRTLKDFVEFNKKNASTCLLDPKSDQMFLRASNAPSARLPTATYNDYVRKLWKKFGDDGLMKALDDYKLDVLVGGPMHWCDTTAEVAGYPVGSALLGYSHWNGAPFALSVIGRPKSEPLILKFLSS